MARKSEEPAAVQSGAEADDLSHLFQGESGSDVVLCVTDETLALLDSAFSADPVGMDSFLSLNFFVFG